MIAEPIFSFSCSQVEGGVTKSALSENFDVYQFIYIDELVYYEVTDNSTQATEGYYPLQGVNYNIEAVTNRMGVVVEWYQISPFGKVKMYNGVGTEKDESSISNRHFFQGRDYDSDIGLVYFRNRWYSPTQSRFVSRDPLRYKAGDINLYRFVGNNPINWVDPSGLLTCLITTKDGFGHSALWIGNEKGYSLYDPGGSFPGEEGYGRVWESNKTATFGGFVSYWTKTGEEVQVNCFESTLEEEEKMKLQMEDTGDTGTFFCSSGVSEVLQSNSTFKDVFSVTPDGLQSEIQGVCEDDKEEEEPKLKCSEATFPGVEVDK